MKDTPIVLPNSLDNFILVEMCERLKAGHVVTMLFGGRSMLPLINGENDTVRLRPLSSGEDCQPGSVYLFRYQGHYVIHRLMRVEAGDYVFRGDNCYAYEHVDRENVLAKLVAIVKADGTVVDCESEAWRTLSRKVLRRRGVKNAVRRIIGPWGRKRLAAVYFVLLALLMWAPINGMAPFLNNYLFGLRADHLFHASVFLFCPLFWTDWCGKRWGWVLLAALLTGVVTECGQYVLPYRGFDVNDLAANCIGNLAGWLVLIPVMLRTRKAGK